MPHSFTSYKSRKCSCQSSGMHMLNQSKQCLPFIPSFRFMPIKVRSLQIANAEKCAEVKTFEPTGSLVKLLVSRARSRV
jgi:hypothetical protein